MTESSHPSQDPTVTSHSTHPRAASPAVSLPSAQYDPRLGAASQGNLQRDNADGADAYGASRAITGETSALPNPNFRNQLQPHQGHEAAHTVQSPTSIVTGTENPAIAPFGSQEWVPQYGPYLDFAPPPRYEPTGELVNEQVETFDSFDDPRARPPQDPFPVLEPPAPPPPFPQEASSGRPAFAPPPPLKSALKRKADVPSSSPVSPGESRKKRNPDLPDTAVRTVSFTRMSNPERSLSAKDPTSPETALEDRPARAGSSASSRSKPPRPGPERGSSSRPTAQSPAPAAKTAGGSSGVLYKEQARESILPLEKVFPIQIGSELFRLSGASITSDGLSLRRVYPDPDLS